ncbi:hypothetical protein H6F44_03165 [Pseudanabaena sp. FACHB-1277]|uniref:Uncharacterized protein n=1 Tax=Pseudanabaena cinerea FACHB-1277 TaxID=2949581 RepID=A0A926UQB8_9CYAN|nr:hypothetical protein [Pseudanabaena cinerea]MBD2149129.1 hypothetical protein [Pseudanabaena cinerea FACHB-1277]
MSQAKTLQDIYSEIADIKDVLCAGLETTSSEISTQITNQLVINPETWLPNELILENTDDDPAITAAQTEINEVLNLAIATIAKDERLATDATLTKSDLSIVPVPSGSPIMLLPKLIKAIVEFQAPLSVILRVLTDIIGDVLLEHIKRKLNEKNCEISAFNSVGQSKIFIIPQNATHIITKISGMPAWVGRDFQDTGLNISLIMPTGLQSLDIAKYSTLHTPEIRFGFRQKSESSKMFPYWRSPQSIEFIDQYFEIPEMGYQNIDRLLYIKSQINHGLRVAWVFPE